MKKIVVSLCLILYCIVTPNYSYTQATLVDLCSAGSTIMPPAAPGMPYATSFTSTVTTGDWVYVSGPSEFMLTTDGIFFTNLVLSPVASNPSITVRRGSGRQETFTLPIMNCADIPPCKTEFAFVMDQSGSMSIGGRWNTLKTTLENYIGSLPISSSLGINDSLALFLYEGNNVRVINRSVFSSLPNLDPTTGVLSTYSPAGTTPIGGGIQGALQRFFKYPGVPWKRQVIVVITDGRQNRNPWLSDVSREIYTNTSRSPIPGILGAGTGAGVLPINFDTPLLTNFIVHNIGIGVGAGGPEYDLLESFATANYFYSTDDSSLSLDEHLTLSTVSAFQGCTPRILEMSIESINSATQSKTLIVNDSTQYLTLRFLAEDRFADPRIEIYYNNTIQDFEPVIRNDKQILYRIDFLSSHNGRIRPSKGVWRVTYSDQKSGTAMPMLFTAIVEDKNIHHSQDFNNVGKVYAGDDIPVRVKVEKDQEGLNQQVTVKAYLLRPGDDLGDLAARNAYDPGSPNPDLTRGQSKMDFISMTKPFSDSLATKKIPEITLTSVGNGEYTGRFSGNKVTGAYQIVSYIQGAYPSLGNFQGRESRFIHVDFSRPEDIRLRDELVFLNKGDNVINHYLLRIRPINKFGRYLGPAQESRIKFSLSDGNVGQVVDNLDGTYSAVLDVPVGSNPQVKIHVIDFEKAVRTRRLSRYDSTGWILCLAGGVSLPLQNLQNTYKFGVFGEIGLGYRFTPQLGVELLGGGYTFRSNHYILGATLWGKYSFNNVNAWGMDLQLGAGAGIFSPKGGSAETGYGLKTGLSKDFQPWFRLGLDASYYNLPNSSSNFATLGVGIQFKL